MGVCWGDRQQHSSPDHAGNTDSTAKKPLVTLDEKDPAFRAGAPALADHQVGKAPGHLLFSLRVLGPGQHSKGKSRRNASGKHILGFDTERLLTMT